MNLTNDELERLITHYISGTITDTERELLEGWCNESSENEMIFREYLNAWESVSLLNDMEQYNSFNALKKISPKLKQSEPLNWRFLLQRAAAILILPLIIYTAYLTFNEKNQINKAEREVVQKISSKQGMVTEFVLNDGTKVWLNSGSELEFPLHFNGEKRNVRLKGEAFFEVTKDKKHPFHVKTNNLNIEVLGTSFNVISFENDSVSEVVLVNGKVSLSAESGKYINDLGFMIPGQKAVYNRDKNQVIRENVEVDKYISWREGYLIFRDDSMEEVVKRLSRWFNVEIAFNSSDKELKSYTYQATFKDENLVQILNLLKLSAPIEYKITPRKLLPNGEFTKLKVNIMRKSN